MEVGAAGESGGSRRRTCAGGYNVGGLTAHVIALLTTVCLCVRERVAFCCGFATILNSIFAPQKPRYATFDPPLN